MAQGGNRHVHLIQQAALVVAPHHAFDPEKAGQPFAARDGLNPVHRRARVHDQVARVEFDALLAVGVLHHQLTAVVVGGGAQKQRAGDVGAHVARGGGVGAHRVVDVVAEVIAGPAVAVEQRRVNRLGQRAGHKHRVARQGDRHDVPRLLGCGQLFGQLAVIFDGAGLAARRDATVGPLGLQDQALDMVEFCGREDLGDT